MDHFIFNGKMYSTGSAIITADNRGLRFGDGLFETIKYLHNEPEFADEHFARLWKGLRVLQFNIPKHFTPDILLQQIHNLLQKNKHGQPARIRLTVFRGDGGLYDPADKLNYIIQSWPLPPQTGSWNVNGLVLGVYTDVKKNCDLLSNLKHNNFLPYAMGALQAKNEKWNDAVLVNNYGRICDTTMANIFLIKNEVVYTPPLSEGCIDGIMRQNVIKRLKLAGFRLAEQSLGTDDLLDADECFLTNSIYNMRWVQSLENKQYANAHTQKIYHIVFATNG